MLNQPPEPLVVRTMRTYQAALLAREQREFQELARRWRDLESTLQAELYALSFEIEQMRLQDVAVSRAALQRMDRYRRLIAQLRDGLESYTNYASEKISAEQLYVSGVGIESAQRATVAAGFVGGFDVLPVRALNNMIGLAGDGSPLTKLLRKAWPDAADGLTEALVQAIAFGWNPYRTARQANLGLANGLERLLLIARTEQLRVYREASRMQYQASGGVVIGYRRLAAKSLRTCIACLVADGRFYPLDVPFEEHPRGRCTTVPVLAEESVEAGPAWQSGRVWFEGLPDVDQKTVIGPKFFDAWKSGRFSLEQIVKRHDDPEWGASLQVRPLRELLAA